MNLFFISILSLLSVNVNKENILKEKLLTNYVNDVLPYTNSNTSVKLKLGIALRAFNEINQIDGTITSNIWLRHWWNDPKLVWNKTEWGISKISLFTDTDIERSIWVPDIYLYNTAESPMENLHYSRAIIYSNGDIIWSRPGIITSTCHFDLEFFPYDQQTCYLKFGSWTYHAAELDLSTKNNDNMDLSNFQKNEGWDILETNSQLDETLYQCCPEVYQAIYYNFKLRRKPGFFVLNIIIPTFATATLMILSLLIPWDSGERISFTMTVMLSIIVFLLILSESLPKTNTKPLLSRMLIGLVFFSLFVVFFTVVISAIHSYTKNNKQFCRKLMVFLNKFNLNCKKNNITRTNSYSNAIRNDTNNDTDIEECNKVVSILENIFTGIFLFSFVVYCLVVFNIKPEY